jgi:hypothetical protein
MELCLGASPYLPLTQEQKTAKVDSCNIYTELARAEILMIQQEWQMDELPKRRVPQIAYQPEETLKLTGMDLSEYD